MGVPTSSIQESYFVDINDRLLSLQLVARMMLGFRHREFFEDELIGNLVVVAFSATATYHNI